MYECANEANEANEADQHRDMYKRGWAADKYFKVEKAVL